MSAATIVSALRRDRADLAFRWVEHFRSGRAAAGHPAIEVDDAIVLALLEDFIAMFEPAPVAAPVPLAEHAAKLADLADFPENIAIAIDLLQAGAQVLGAFVVEHAGPWAAWTIRDRNRFLGELDAVFPLLVRREVSALCDRYFPGETAAAPPASVAGPTLPEWARAIARRRN